MNFVELFLIAFGLSMDAFAVAVCAGLTMRKTPLKKMLTVGLYFGFFQAIMPLAGYLLANLFANQIIDYDHWVAFVLLCFLGIKMIIGSLKKEEFGEQGEIQLSPKEMLPLAVATSIDALAAGVSFAFLKISIVPAVSFIGIITLVLSMAGVKIGSVFGTKLKAKAEIFGGVILIVMGTKILLEHLEIIKF